MGFIAVMGAGTMCSFGTAPSSIAVVLSQMTSFLENKPIATIQDCQMLNIPPFLLCRSPANPAVAAATAAAFGVLTPMPCTLVAVGTWLPTKPLMISNIPVLTNESQLICAFGGIIGMTNPGQFKCMV